MVARGSIVVDAGTITPTGIKRETVSIRAGLFHQNIPTLKSESATNLAIYGRGREIIVQGYFRGTQAQIEQFVYDIEAWVNAAGLQETAKYYPLFYPLNLSAQAGSQSYYWNVLCDEFEWDFDEDEPERITFTLVLREGTKLGPFSSVAGGS